MNSHYYQRIIEHYLQSYNTFDVEGMLRDLHKEVVFENSANGEINLKTEGRTAFKEQAEAAKAYFKERQQSVGEWVFIEDQIIIEVDYRGVLAVDLPNGLKAGDTLELQGQSVFTFVDGLIVKIQDKS